MSWNQQVGKKLNKEMILQEVLISSGTGTSGISRNEIIEKTSLKKATVANLVKELIEEQFIVEAGMDVSTGGRRSKLLKLNGKAGYALGIDIGVNYLRGIITDLNGVIVFDNNEEILDTTFTSYFRKIVTLIQLLELNVPASPYKIIGLGIAVPGIIDTEGLIIKAPNLGWQQIDLITMLKDHVNYPIYISNEANAGGFAEFSFIHNHQHQNLLFVSIGFGIGVGIFVNGELYHGELGFSGESGHMIIQVNGKKCRCGRNGCWEAYASEYALLQEAEAALTIPDLTLEKLIALSAKEKDIQNIFTDIGHYIGIGLVNLIYTFNPSKIIIGNRITLLQDQIKQSMIDITTEQSSAPFVNKTEIEFSTLQDKAIVLGAASIVINHFLQPSIMGAKNGINP
ncbi:ROK family protein [Lysinibacillus sp. 2017]|uniref:ROK family protein n=1 Tax=unclassified Lysinibacillus TaxID=2636778 RepID=UPI000D5291B6|nr:MULTISPECIES: ROK family protein [unclassified Lysinibacillus]AWE08525.1 ROK family protein [Lysinibacillus sp. 2017]TGN35618.1 ROK family protein [Lysinibacillus sp. S2017]